MQQKHEFEFIKYYKFEGNVLFDWGEKLPSI